MVTIFNSSSLRAHRLSSFLMPASIIIIFCRRSGKRFMSSHWLYSSTLRYHQLQWYLVFQGWKRVCLLCRISYIEYMCDLWGKYLWVIFIINIVEVDNRESIAVHLNTFWVFDPTTPKDQDLHIETIVHFPYIISPMTLKYVVLCSILSSKASIRTLLFWDTGFFCPWRWYRIDIHTLAMMWPG